MGETGAGETRRSLGERRSGEDDMAPGKERAGSGVPRKRRCSAGSSGETAVQTGNRHARAAGWDCPRRCVPTRPVQAAVGHMLSRAYFCFSSKGSEFGISNSKKTSRSMMIAVV